MANKETAKKNRQRGRQLAHYQDDANWYLFVPKHFYEMLNKRDMRALNHWVTDSGYAGITDTPFCIETQVAKKARKGVRADFITWFSCDVNPYMENLLESYVAAWNPLVGLFEQLYCQVNNAGRADWVQVMTYGNKISLGCMLVYKPKASEAS